MVGDLNVDLLINSRPSLFHSPLIFKDVNPVSMAKSKACPHSIFLNMSCGD
jgi:hypothetical protein